MSSSMTEFPAHPDVRGAVHQNMYLARGTREVHAVITVDAHADPSAPADTPAPGAAEVLILDCSASMNFPAEKINKTKEGRLRGHRRAA